MKTKHTVGIIFTIIWLSNILYLSVPDEGFSRILSCISVVIKHKLYLMLIVVDETFVADLIMLKYKILESQIIVKSLGAGKPKGLNRIAKIYRVHPLLRVVYLINKYTSNYVNVTYDKC
jgi:hypothetical protein